MIPTQVVIDFKRLLSRRPTALKSLLRPNGGIFPHLLQCGIELVRLDIFNLKQAPLVVI